MKLISTVALVLTLGVTLVLTLGAGRAQTEQQPLKMTFSGSTMSTQNILQAGGSPTGEATAAGDSSFGPFSIRDLDAIGAPLPPGSCGEPNSLGFPFVPGGGAVFRFQDGSLLTLKTTGNGTSQKRLRFGGDPRDRNSRRFGSSRPDPGRSHRRGDRNDTSIKGGMKAEASREPASWHEV